MFRTKSETATTFVLTIILLLCVTVTHPKLILGLYAQLLFPLFFPLGGKEVSTGPCLTKTPVETGVNVPVR